MSRLFSLARPQPSQCLANSIHSGTDGFRPSLNQINIFRVAQRLREQQLVNGSAAPKCNPLGDEGIVEQVAQCTRNNQILLDLSQIWPRRVGTPGMQVGDRDQASISTVSFTTNFHFEFFSLTSACIAAKAAGNLTEGSSNFIDLAVLAKGRSASACRS